MKSIYILLIFAFIIVIPTHAQEIIQIKSFDGEIIEGRLNVPHTGFKDKIVIDIPGTGPHTYINRRKVGRSLVFNFHDYFAEEFNKRGIAYFSYSTRYTEPDTTPPNFDRVDKQKFLSCTPSIKVKDVEAIINHLKNDERLKSSQIILLGQSEGAIIATLVAENKTVPVDVLLLTGVPSENIYSTIEWQLSGESSMINMRKFFDANEDGIVQKDEYENGDPRALARVGNMNFGDLDLNHDSVLTSDDYAIMLKPSLEAILNAIENNDDEWIWNNFFRIGTKWIKEHKNLEPNISRILRLDIPVFIFHGENDANCPVTGVIEIRNKAEKLGKDNIHVFTFPEHDHSLEFLAWVIRDSIPDGLKALFDKSEEL